MSNCLPNCPCGSTILPSFEETFEVSPCVADIGDPTEFHGCPQLDREVGRCQVDVLVPVCEDGTSLECAVDVYTAAYSGTIHFIISVPVFDGETCPLPEALTFDIPVDIGTQYCYYCEMPCLPDSECPLVGIENLSAVLNDDNTITISGQPVFNCPGA
ncbi:hypothetical protein D3H55_19075 [Bacillus salacetis]|uniref:Uncharacterized protein n=1 Tax=Bacillus salacetis TaxID=2315464 RepID=A0A3A1QQH7_9BACI|nr:hypothetical protein [Bacillus salacetis]RIW29366.1 hypothetical protein D3H55_19075 [Bacillus salacetis]